MHSEARRVMLVQHRMSLIVVGRGVPSQASLADKIGRFLLASFTARESLGLQESVISQQNFYFPLDMCCCRSSQCASKPLSRRDSSPTPCQTDLDITIFCQISTEKQWMLRPSCRDATNPRFPPLYLLSWNSDPQSSPSTAVGPRTRATGLRSQADRSRRLHTESVDKSGAHCGNLYFA